jgi:hypothetical protein
MVVALVTKEIDLKRRDKKGKRLKSKFQPKSSKHSCSF